jgi:hypothetical protein
MASGQPRPRANEGKEHRIMGAASSFIWIMVVLLGLAWALAQTGTVNLGVNFNLWVNLLLVLAVLGAIFNLFIVPFLSRSRTTTTATHSDAVGQTNVGGVTTAPAATVAPPPTAAAPVAPAAHSGAASQEVVQETRDRTSL